MRALGAPSASTVASVMAVGSRGSEAVASFSQARKQPQGLVGGGEITTR